MDLPVPRFVVAHAVLQPSNALPRDPNYDEKFIEAVRDQFPNVVSRQFMPPDAPPQIPHLVLASSSSQVAVSSGQIDFEVRFYGDYLDDLSRALDYVESKVHSILRGFEALGTTPSLVGLIGTFHFGSTGTEWDPVEHVLRTHLRGDIAREDVQDAQAKVALRVADKYFVNLTVNNYESRSIQRPIMPNMGLIRIRPWEGSVTETGIELTLDVNNNLEGRVLGTDPTVTQQGVPAVVGILRDVAVRVGPRYVATGETSAAALSTGAQA